MIELDATNIAGYLRSHGHISPGEAVQTLELPGGVSNKVIRIVRPSGDDLIIKQARERLNVAEPWYCSIDRIWREVDVLGACGALLQGTSSDGFSLSVPQVLFEDREQYLFAMTAVFAEHVVWKSELMAGVARSDVARACGRMLGILHARSWHDETLANRFESREFFEILRLDPYYRQVARVHASLAPAIERLIDSVARERHCLVHGDFSPKNLLVERNRLTLLDFEVGHYGDPAFDLGFFLSHLLLKASHHAPASERFLKLADSFWNNYRDELATVIGAHELDALTRRAILNVAGCALARLDGKSKIEYLRDERRREQVRELCRTILAEEPGKWEAVRSLVAAYVSSATT